MPILSCVSEPDRTKHLAARPLATPGWWHCANCGQCWQEAVSTLCDHCGAELKFSPCCGRLQGLLARMDRCDLADYRLEMKLRAKVARLTAEVERLKEEADDINVSLLAHIDALAAANEHMEKLAEAVREAQRLEAINREREKRGFEIVYNPTVYAEALRPAAPAEEPKPEVVHQCPPKGSGVMPCCGKTPFETLNDRMTLDPALVTCGKRP